MIPNQQQNPLKKFFRQPKIYLRLPSHGRWYPPGSLTMPESGELPVYAMTAKDEITMKTPDALINGQATVDVIQSCIPDIKNAWMVPSIDIDAILVAIRLATYGEKLAVTGRVPLVDLERDYEVDLRTVLGDLLSNEFESVCLFGNNELAVHLRPLNYKEFTANALKTFEEQKVLRIVNDENISDEQKLEAFNKSFKKLTEMTVTMITSSVEKIETNEDSVNNPKFIKEFIENADKEFYQGIADHLEKERAKFNLKPITVKSLPQDIEEGAPETFEINISFDQSNFFA